MANSFLLVTNGSVSNGDIIMFYCRYFSTNFCERGEVGEGNIVLSFPPHPSLTPLETSQNRHVINRYQTDDITWLDGVLCPVKCSFYSAR